MSHRHKGSKVVSRGGQQIELTSAALVTMGLRRAAQLKVTREAVAKQPGRGFGIASSLPSTSQWQCPHCRQPNVGRATTCGGCGESREGATA